MLHWVCSAQVCRCSACLVMQEVLRKLDRISDHIGAHPNSTHYPMITVITKHRRRA